MLRTTASRIALALTFSGALIFLAVSLPAVGRASDALRPDRIPQALADSVAVLEGRLSKEQFSDAERMGRRLLADVEARHGTASLEAAAVLDPLARAVVGAHFFGGLREAEEMARRALAIREGTLGHDHLDVASSLLTLSSVIGVLGGRVGEYADTDELVRRARTIRERVLGPDHPLVARCLALGASKAIEFGEFEAARRDLERALGILERAYGPADVRLLEPLTGLADLAHVTGDDLATRSLLDRVLSIRERNSGPDSLLLLDALESLHNLAYARGDMEEVARISERTIRIAERGLDPMSPVLATKRAAMLTVMLAKGEGEKGVAIWEKLHAEAERRLGADHLTVGLHAGNLGTHLLMMGRGREARTWLERALPAIQRNIPDGHVAWAVMHHFLGAACLEAGDATDAVMHLEKALTMREASLGPISREVAETLATLSRAYWQLGDQERAIRTVLLMEERTRSSLRALAGSLSERQALRYAATRSHGLPLALRYASRATHDSMSSAVWDAVIRSRALVLDEIAGRIIAGVGDHETARHRETLAAARKRAANLMVRGPGQSGAERYRALLGHAVQEREAAERALALASASFRRSLERERVGCEDVRAATPAGSAVLSYVLQRRWEHRIRGIPTIEPSSALPPSYFVIVDRPDARVVRILDLGEARQIDSLVSEWTGLAAAAPRPGREARIREAGRRLRERIWDPLAPLLAGIERVFVVPDGAIHRVPFAALPLDSAGYLAETEPHLHYLSAERDLVPGGSPRPKHSDMLAFGGPDFDILPRSDVSGNDGTHVLADAVSRSDPPYRGPLPGCPGFHGMKFAPIPGSARELEEVRRAWRGSARVRLGTNATEGRFKAEATSAGVLHIATHGFSLDAECSDASARGIGGLKRADVSAPLHVAVEESPLLRSGLALAGANRRAEAAADGEDGILTAEEIAALDLSGVRWAVLSACNTGRGDIQTGEGVMGLRRAFQIAGASTLIMSLWPVDDEATREWMGALYRARFGRGMGTAEAVREASLETLRTRRARGESDHPFYWAGFVAAGDWR